MTRNSWIRLALFPGVLGVILWSTNQAPWWEGALTVAIFAAVIVAVELWWSRTLPAGKFRAAACALIVFGAMAVGAWLLHREAPMESMQVIRARNRTTHEVLVEVPRIVLHYTQRDWLGVFDAQMALAKQGMGPKVTCWASGEFEIEVETPRNPGETEEQWCDRHDDAVDAAQETYPNEGECQE